MKTEETASKICPRCRHKDPLGASACGSCGHHYPVVDAFTPPPTAARPTQSLGKTMGAAWLWFIPLIVIGGWQYKATHHSHSDGLNVGGLWGKPRGVILARLAPFPLVASSAVNTPLSDKDTTYSAESDTEWETVKLSGVTEASVVLNKNQLDSVIVRHIRVPHSSLDHPEGVFQRFGMTVPDPPDRRLPSMAQWDNWHGCRLRLLTKEVGGPVTAMKVDALGGTKVHDDSLSLP